VNLLPGSGLSGSYESKAGRHGVITLQRSQRAVLVSLILLTVGAWALTIGQTQSMSPDMDIAVQRPVQDDAPNAMGGMDAMAGMDETAGPGMAEMAGTGWSLGGLAAFVGAWSVMMVAMMLPAVAPMLLLYRTMASKSTSTDAAFVSTWILVVGYLLVWTVVGVGVYALVRFGGGVAGGLGVTERERWAPLALGSILVVAGLYQFTPLKHACLRQCQSPFGFIMGHWRDGKMGALRMGVAHGAYCLGCCWALFAVLVATGVMSLAWMLVLTLVVFAEKVLPMGRRTAQVVGAAFLLLGVLIASGATAMPWRI
jgi:predicted metal-binding membrane protein